MNTELSAFYFDIRKDTLYCDPPSSVARKAALTTIDIICDAILRWLAPVLSFTTDEAWRMYRPDAEPSVHLTLFPEGFDEFRDDALAAKWETIRNVRRVVTGALELERAAKNIGSSLEASPLVYVSDKKIFDTLFDVDLAEVCITSNAMVTNDDAPAERVHARRRPRRRRRGREGRRAPNARGRGRSCRPSAKTPNIPTSRRATRRPCANGRRWGVSAVVRPSSSSRPGTRRHLRIEAQPGARQMTRPACVQRRQANGIPSQTANRHGVWVPAYRAQRPDEEDGAKPGKKPPATKAKKKKKKAR